MERSILWLVKTTWSSSLSRKFWEKWNYEAISKMAKSSWTKWHICDWI